MNITEFVIKRKTFVSMLFIALVMLGLISYQQLPVELFPNAELPFLIVQARSQLDMDPTYIETQAIVPLEGAVSTLEGIDRIESFVERNGGVIYVYFNQKVNTKYAYLRLDEKINSIKATLGDEFQVAVIKIDTEQLSNQFMSLEVRGAGGLDRVREIADQKVTEELQNVDGVAGVQIFGGREKSIEIILDEDACRAFDVTPAYIRNLIAQNAQYKTFVGKAYDKNRYYFVNLVADYTQVSQIENIVVNDVGPVLLKDVAEVFFGVKDQTSLSRVNGQDAVTVQLSRDSQANLIDVAHKTRDVIASLNNKLAGLDVEIVIQSDSAEQIEDNIDMIIQLALFGGLLAVFVLWIFLRNIRWVLIITLALPISIFAAFNFFYAGEISINSLTLVGMALAVGMLLDNSVVVMENIYRLLSKGRPSETAVVQGTQEVWRSILAATLTTITVFLPFVFAENFIIRLLGRHIGVSIISTLLVSLAVALLLIPMATFALLRRSGIGVIPSFQKVSQKNRLLQVYNVILKSSMRFPARTIIGAVVLFFLSLIIALAVSVNVPEEVESREFSLYVTMSSGATLDGTDLVVQEIEKALEDLTEREEVISKVYEEDAIVTVKLVEDFEKLDGRSLEQIKKDVDDRTDNVRGGEISFEQPMSSQRFRGGGGGGRNPGGSIERMLGIGAASESIVIKGRNFEVMRNLADDISDYLDDLDTIQRSSVSAAANRPQVSLYFDMMMMNNYGLTLQDVAGELSSFRSEINTQLSFQQDTEVYDIVIRSDSLVDKKLDDLKMLEVQASASRESYQMQDISNIILSEGLATINRVNQEKQVEVNYSFISEITDSRELLDASRFEVDELIAGLTLPTGIAVEVVHDDTDLSDFYFLIGAAFILIFMILAAVFESLSTPVVMMFTIPLAAIGSLWALVFTGNSLLNANTLIGFLILLGVVVNNGIIYIDYTRILRGRGFRRPRALMLAGHARVRPILITAITTIIALIPLAMGTAEYVAKIGSPFAITVIGGLSLSTLFTLVFIPTLFSGLENTLAWMRGLNWRLKAAQLVSWLFLIYFVYTNVDSALWKIVNLLLVTILVPGATYFMLTSLRRASTTIIDPNEPLTISIRRLVKVYDESSRFVREWGKGKVVRNRSGLEKSYKSWKDFDDLIWQLPLSGFLVYFTYYYLQSYFWSFIFSHVVYFVLIYLLKPFQLYASQTKPKWIVLAETLRKILFWFAPLLNLAYFYFRWESIGSVIFIAVLWYFGLAIYTTSNKLQHESVNISRVAGRFSGMRRAFYRFVQVIPVIGRKRTPFRALDGVSLEIGNGMFGLLGPNGAGKTTLMRIICGIFEQSRGKIWINGRDLSQYREELQGLIGYLPQEFGMYENMTAYEFLDYQAMLKGLKEPAMRKERIQQVLASVHMDDRQQDKIGSFSGGMKQRIGIAQTLLHLPRILVVDEPTAGLDPRERIRFRNLLVELGRERIVIFSTHIIEDISSSCNRVAVLNHGKLKYLGEPSAMAKLANDRVWQFMVDGAKFDEVQKQFMVVHHMRIGEQVRVRCISESQPAADAIKVNPTLEDSYLWLLKK
jgi:multidrug efflux pump subunit AcrB/ABC-type multidrug transport system ATPase subunit